MVIDFTDYPHDLRSSEVILILNNEFPALVHGVDYWVAHQVKENSPERISPAVIVKWEAGLKEPTPEQLAAYAARYAVEITALQTAEARSIQFAAKTPLEFRNTLTANSIYPKSVQSLIDGVDDPTLNARLETYWEYTDWFRRDDEFTVWLAAALGKKPAQFDAIWLAS
ncbi:hypothetical protein FY140_03450 [Agrobacterium tumefaciens]|uniref:helix-turn-helix domain-containing protein n=1 Tax=Agrobacterium tumefaciens TaxID=358 RepID=UPI00161A4110|nr:helix-turn-helix transcriptional regulator [Agrobacterium tumefaciens]MBB2905838.1 hypothetical protein [Rhizobium sp. RAS22]UXT19837.1 hypothetical protein FY140_03450 [Agrobacterium tumefaciens]